MIIRRVGIWSAARLYGAMLAALGLVFGAIFALASMVGGAFAPEGSGSGPLAMMFGAGAIILLPIFYGILGVVIGAITAGLYNLFARMIGGLEVETEP